MHFYDKTETTGLFKYQCQLPNKGIKTYYRSSRSNMAFNHGQCTTPLNLTTRFDEHRWVIQIRRTFDDELEDDIDDPISIFSVPKALMVSKPEAYVPQQVSLGPYHHLRPELYEMERYKLSAAKRIQKQLPSLKFQHLVDHLVKIEHLIRSCYHRYLDFKGETLAWMMAVDTSFLLEFLQIYAVSEGRVLTRVPSRMSHLIDYTGRRSAHNVILRDIIMLENQIPLFLLRKVLEFQYASSQVADDKLSFILMGLVKELSPFKVMENDPHFLVAERAHLLELLYFMLVPKKLSEIMDPNEQNETDSIMKEESKSSLVSSLCGGLVHCIKKAIASRAMKFLVKIPWRIITNLPVISIIKQLVEIFFYQEKENPKPGDEFSGPHNNNNNRPPLVEEIQIPSVTELVTVGFHFVPTNGDLSTIKFDKETATFYLPFVRLDVNTEVILRNLVAFETSAASGPLVFTRYTELMNGIIDTVEDVKLLRQKGIILNCLKSDGEAANLWNGMSKSVRLTKVHNLDKVIEDVNKYYNGRWKVMVEKFMKRYVFGLWQFLTFLAAILLLLLTAFQAFCSVYKCARWSNV
ncbi:putative UPF0481 protein [Cinnamomum micranthum f. kanehirae]|uniref:Putative UPF0481 protein n=1 Tax=Cinnamomum micranthum f. kanehirae TaxID=337451 RepID=A0A3S3MVF3_9MAGN|nr:putative UPF0481 protein [Cinnamomum micranthum f. kanehirae]